MTSWFTGTGAFSAEELAEFIKDYERSGKHNWDTQIDLGEDVNPGVERLVNELTSSMGRLGDRLALTIVDLYRKRPEQHTGDCTIYASVLNGKPEDGICTCGYGLSEMRDGDARELYSAELQEKLMCVGGNI